MRKVSFQTGLFKGYSLEKGCKPNQISDVTPIMHHHNILIAEDEARLAAFIAKGLRKHGFVTAIAEDGKLAIQMVQTEAIELLLLDLGLPIVDGWGVLRELRSQGNTMPIIAITAQDNERSKANAFACGATDFVSKPFHFKELLEKVRSHLRIAP
jgi:two-component system, OmpR family, copper resistance phosphate regulon response regulator CusR